MSFIVRKSFAAFSTSRWIAAAFVVTFSLFDSQTGNAQGESGGIKNSQKRNEPTETKRVAVITTEYRHNSHSDVIASRMLLTDMLDGTGAESPLKMVSLYTDQFPAGDMSRLLSASHRFPVMPTISDTLTLRSGTLAVDGVMIIAEHGNYPFSATGNHQYPKRRFWDQTLKVFRQTGKVVPVFMDKHLCDNWEDSKFIYDTAKEMKIPMMAGSSIPGTWRFPPADVKRNEKIREIVGFTHGSTDAYGFHGIEGVQALAEQRYGGETGVRAVQCFSNDEVWKEIENRTIDPDLYAAALSRVPGFGNGERLDWRVARYPKLMIIEYEDGLKTSLIELNRDGGPGAWTAAWRTEDGKKIESTQFWTQEARPAFHFNLLVKEIENMFFTGQPSWPVERTLMTSGVLDALLQSRTQGSKRLLTPHLKFAYQSNWRWKQPPTPPKSRPWGEQ